MGQGRGEERGGWSERRKKEGAIGGCELALEWEPRASERGGGAGDTQVSHGGVHAVTGLGAQLARVCARAPQPVPGSPRTLGGGPPRPLSAVFSRSRADVPGERSVPSSLRRAPWSPQRCPGPR